MEIIDKLKVLHTRAENAGYTEEAVIIADAALEIEFLQNELKKTQTALKVQEEGK